MWLAGRSASWIHAYDLFGKHSSHVRMRYCREYRLKELVHLIYRRIARRRKRRAISCFDDIPTTISHDIIKYSMMEKHKKIFGVQLCQRSTPWWNVVNWWQNEMNYEKNKLEVHWPKERNERQFVRPAAAYSRGKRRSFTKKWDECCLHNTEINFATETRVGLQKRNCWFTNCSYSKKTCGWTLWQERLESLRAQTSRVGKCL